MVTLLRIDGTTEEEEEEERVSARGTMGISRRWRRGGSTAAPSLLVEHEQDWIGLDWILRFVFFFSLPSEMDCWFFFPLC